jgi:hypothetical protein
MPHQPYGSDEAAVALSWQARVPQGGVLPQGLYRGAIKRGAQNNEVRMSRVRTPPLPGIPSLKGIHQIF